VSKDFQLAWECPHLTVEEHVQLASDRVSLLTTQPIGASTTVRVLYNNDAFIPQGGLYRAAQLFSTVSGPYDIVENEDEFTVETSAGSETFTFGVTGTQRYTAQQVVNRLYELGMEAALPEVDNSHLVLTDVENVGQASYVRVSGSAAESLGFGSATGASRQRGDRGRQLYPGWVLAKRSDTVSTAVYRFPRFVSPIKNNPIFKVTYSVPARSCKRCRGTFIENDYRFNSAGQGIFIENENLLYQSALKMVLTDRGSNPYHGWVGTSIREKIGQKAIGNVAALISEDVRRALTRLQDVQSSQAEYQQVTAKERLYAILGVRTVPHAQDPTTFLADITIQNASGEPITLSIVFSVPEVVALLGSNGLFLGPEADALERARQDRLYPTPRTLLFPEGT